MNLANRYLDLIVELVNGSIYGAQTVYDPVAASTPAKRIVIKVFEHVGCVPMRVHQVPTGAYDIGNGWPIPRPPACYSMIGRARLNNVRMATETVIREGVPGNLIETGVWKGGACILMKAVLAAYEVHDRDIYVADSFRGLPQADASDDAAFLHDDATLSISQTHVRKAFEQYGLLDDGVRFIEGWFSETLPTLSGTPWAVVRLDGDQYQSTMDSIFNLYPDLSPGGFLIVDDYNTFEACRRAVTEYRNANGITDPIVNIDLDGVYWRKTTASTSS